MTQAQTCGGCPCPPRPPHRVRLGHRPRRPVISLALRLAAVDGLQRRADTSEVARKAHQRAAAGAVFEGWPTPPPVRMPWPDRLKVAVSAYRAYQSALAEYRVRPEPEIGENARPPQGLLLPVTYDRLVHELSGLATREGKESCEFTVITAQDRFRSAEEARAWGANRAWAPRTGQPVEL